MYPWLFLLNYHGLNNPIVVSFPIADPNDWYEKFCLLEFESSIGGDFKLLPPFFWPRACERSLYQFHKIWVRAVFKCDQSTFTFVAATQSVHLQLRILDWMKHWGCFLCERRKCLDLLQRVSIAALASPSESTAHLFNHILVITYLGLSMMYVSGCCIIPIRMVMIHCHLVNGEVRTKSPPNCTSTAWIPAVIIVTNGSARFFPIPLNMLSSLSRIRDEYSLNICKKMNALNTIVVSV